MSRTCTCRCVASDSAPAPPTATDCRANSTCVLTKSLRTDKEALHAPKPPSRGPSTGFHRPR
jgi:ribosomal protein L40E